MKPDTAPRDRFAPLGGLCPQEVIDNSKRIAGYWKTLREKYPAERLAKSA